MAVTIYPVTDFLDRGEIENSSLATYYYQGNCPYTHKILTLPRTRLVEAIAWGLMRQLERDAIYELEGKMYGVLLVETPAGQQGVIRAFSGLLGGKSSVDGWVTPIPGRDRTAEIEAVTLAELEIIKQELIALNNSPDHGKYQQLNTQFSQELEELNRQHRERKIARDKQREEYYLTMSGKDLEIALATLQYQSQQDGIERRNFKRDRDAQLQPLKATIDRAEEQMRSLKQQRKTLSRQLQAQMHAAHNLMNFLGTSASLRDLIPGGIPTGTGDCCAPKLLHFAATHKLKPLAMAEFWWGSTQGDKIQGEFYPACTERCQPLMGFLLSGITDSSLPHQGSPRGYPYDSQLATLYQDEWIIAIDKPSGLLSVPGRYLDRQDSVLTRLRRFFPGEELFAVHRLDRDTSGILLFARDRDTYRHLSQQFAYREVNKRYEAILGGRIHLDSGEISLPLGADLLNPPRQQVDWKDGKPSITKFRVLEESATSTRIEFIPLTGRTHQLRVHSADAQGLGVPILGDRLYGCCQDADRLHLHAIELHFSHPQTGALIQIHAPATF
jgi:tRNA pseudouridine32 synthase/23S rRNA pseudouridine746 synthase